MKRACLAVNKSRLALNTYEQNQTISIQPLTINLVRMRSRFLFLILLFSAFALGINAQNVPVTFYYKATSGNPVNVYLAGSMNGYNASDAQYKLTNVGNNIFTITKDLAPNDYVYKYVVDGNWVTDPYNPVTDGSQYNNSKLTVSEPMITYFLPAFNESFSSSNLPLIKVMVATADNNIALANYTLTINSNAITGTPTLSSANKVLTYTPAASELNEGNNTCEISVTASGKTVAKTIQFQYSSQSGGSDFSVSGQILDATKLPVVGVKISNGTSQVYTDAVGRYTLPGCNATMTITPSKSGWSFDPQNISLSSYQADVTDANFIAIEGGGGEEPQKIQYTISGTVKICGNPVEGAEIESRGKVVYTVADGSYTIVDEVETNGSYYQPSSVTVTLNSENYAGETSRQIYFSGNYAFTGVNFTGVYAEDSITGKVSYPSDMPYAEKPLKWEVFEGEIKSIDDKPLFDSIVYTDLSGNYKARHFYFPNNGPNDYYTFRIKPDQNGYQYNPVIIRSYHSCNSLKDKNMAISFAAVPICMVTVSPDNHNTIVWEKPASDEIEGFAIYKESNIANNYLPIDTVDYNDIAVFVDAASDPSVKAYRYKLSTLLKQNYSVLNDSYHKTIHLTINKGIGNSWNLIWSHYEGIPISTYKLYRGTDKNNITYLTDIAGNLNSYTDNTAPAGDVFYQIEMILENACNPEVAKPLLKSTQSASSYSSTKSNIVNTLNAVTSINNIVASGDLIYPNPVKNTIYLKEVTTNCQFELYSVQGMLIGNGSTNATIDVSHLKSGIYYLKMNKNNQWTTCKFIKE